MSEIDIDLDRKIAKNWKEYLREIWKARDAFVWTWKEFNNDSSRTIVKKLLVILIIGNLLGVVAPWALGTVFSGLKINSSAQLITFGLALYALVTIVKHLVFGSRGLICRILFFGKQQRQLTKRSSELFFEKSLGLHIDEHNLLNAENIKKGCDRTDQLYSLIIWEIIESFLVLILCFGALWFLNFKIALIFTLMFIIHLPWTVVINQRVMEKETFLDKKWRALNRYWHERLMRVERVKTNCKEQEEINEFGRKFDEIIDPDIKLWRWFVHQTNWRGFIDYLFLIGVISYGSFMVRQGELTMGLFFPLCSWSIQLVDGLWKIGHLEHKINFVIPSISAMKETLTRSIGLEIPDKFEQLPGDIINKVEFRNIGYIYPEQKDLTGKIRDPIPILEDISFIIERGEKVAIMGSSGVGKTTIVRLLLRYMDPTSGDIFLNGVDLKSLVFESWLPKVGYMPQEAQIFDGTLRYNLTYGLSNEEKSRISDEELWELMFSLKIDFVERLTHGLDTLVGRNGIKLSGGQAQRLMLGAAVIKKPSFLIIDEATSSLDATTERLVQEGLGKILSREMSVVIITHRLNTVRRIGNKFVMLSGNGSGSNITAIAENFEELAEKSSEFRQLAKDQGIVL